MGRRDLPIRELTGHEEELERPSLTVLHERAECAHTSDSGVRGRRCWSWGGGVGRLGCRSRLHRESCARHTPEGPA